MEIPVEKLSFILVGASFFAIKIHFTRHGSRTPKVTQIFLKFIKTPFFEKFSLMVLLIHQKSISQVCLRFFQLPEVSFARLFSIIISKCSSDFNKIRG